MRTSPHLSEYGTPVQTPQWYQKNSGAKLHTDNRFHIVPSPSPNESDSLGFLKLVFVAKEDNKTGWQANCSPISILPSEPTNSPQITLSGYDTNTTLRL